MRSHPCLAAILAMGVAVACAGADEPNSSGGGAVTVEDSAGVRIVEHAAVPDAPMLGFAAEPLYTHGTREGDYAFQNIDSGNLSGVLYPDGSAVIADWGNREVVRIGPLGRAFEVIARAGEGPGEFGGRSPRLIAGGQDTLLVQDTWNRRILLYAGGSPTGTVRLPGSDDETGSLLHGRDAAGHLLMTSSWPSGRRPVSDGSWTAGRMLRLDLAGPDRRHRRLLRPAAARTRRSHQHAPFRHGGLVGSAGGELVFGRTDRPELVWRRSDGTIHQIMRWRPAPVYTTQESWDRWIACMRDAYLREPGMTEAMVEQSLGRFEFVGDEPEPQFGRIFSDDQGRIWLGNFRVACYNTPRYTVIAPDGTWLGVFEPPAGFELLATANRRVLGVETDEMGVESVAVYEVVGW